MPELAIVLRTLGKAAGTVEPSSQLADQGLGPGKPLALITWLSSVPGASCRREQAIDLLWSDVELEQARHALRQTIWYIRRRLHDAAIVSTRDTIGLGLPVRSDHRAFLDSVNAGRFEEAIELYHGDFLPDLALPGGADFEHWADVERQQIRLAFLHAARAVARLWSSAARHREAIAIARHVRDMEGSEASWRLLFETLIAARDTIGAALEADALEQLFRDPNELEPSTRALLRTARLPSGASPERARESGLVAELVGREAEFASLVSAWERARSGTTVTVRLAGAAGLGKTRLLNDLAARLRATRAQVVSVAARPAERFVPFAHAADVAAAIASVKGAAAVSPANASALVALNPSLSGSYAATPSAAHGDSAFLQRVIAIQELIGRVSEEAPFALLLDDQHWADQESRRLLAAVISRLQHEPALVIAAARPGYTELPLGETSRLELMPLASASTLALVGSIAELPAEEWATLFCGWLHDISGGSPLLVLETLQSLVERGLAQVVDGRWSIANPAAVIGGQRTTNTMDLRVQSSTDAERIALASLALIGEPASPAFVAGVAGSDVAETTAVLHALESRGLAISDGDRWTPSHDLLSERFVDRLSPTERARLNRGVGVQLLANPGADESSLVRAAAHFAEAGEPDRVADAFVPWLRIRRDRGDMRSVRRLALAFSPVLAALPLWNRVSPSLRFPRWRLGAAAMAVLLVVAGATRQMVGPTTPPPEEILLAWYDSAGRSYEWNIPLRRSALAAGGVLPVTAGVRAEIGSAPNRTRDAVSPDGSRWIGDRVFNDSGGMDLVLLDGRHRLIARMGSTDDDFGASWSPDGRQIAFATGRYNPDRWSDIAIQDLQTGVARQLTSGDDIDRLPRWGPLGTTIAFSRTSHSGAAQELCEVAIDGSRLRCISSPTSREVLALGWYDERRIVAVLHGDGQRESFDRIRLIDLRDSSASRDILRAGSIGEATLSPDGKWIACACQTTGQNVSRWTIFPVDNPELQAEIVRDRIETLPLMLGWGMQSPRASYLTGIEIPPALEAYPINATSRLVATGRRADGRIIEDFPVVWSVISGHAARVEGDRLVPVRPGVIRLRAEAPGWAAHERDMTIGPPASTTVATWNWSDSLEKDWELFGLPLPYIGPDSLFTRALIPNGDGSFASGVYSRATFDASAGLVAKLDVSIAITRNQWQGITISFVEEADSVPIHVQPGDAADFGTWRRSCGLGVPAGEGAALRNTVSVVNGNPGTIVPISPQLVRGARLAVLVQLFPDGSCGAAIDGKPLAHLPITGPPFRRARLVIGGRSVQTHVSVGPVVLARGTDPRLDWRPLFLVGAPK